MRTNWHGFEYDSEYEDHLCAHLNFMLWELGVITEAFDFFTLRDVLKGKSDLSTGLEDE